ncbi:dipeptide epimerase [candidate division KSB3 bacterium]|uniref:Dipeptide epimerase n=1 Tax=candidate division KSB3 bacterium TaxID=2044937 RepID=A0A9D5JX59_9BACT|nr:dipeptide epimerase [candidate division KSB3 bacterium]MBD3325774.1 dipeptide epimerase [candidate division KSB3 bacterium]
MEKTSLLGIPEPLEAHQIPMQIQAINAYSLKIPLTQTWSISYSTESDCETVLIEILTDEGLTGYGEASPFPPVTGDTPQTVLAVLEELTPRLIGKNPLAIRSLIDELDMWLTHNGPAKAAIDIALHDLAAKYYQVPVKLLLGGQCREKVVTSLTAWLGTVEETVERVGSLLQQHHAKIIKLKIGQDVQLDVERVKAIRESYGSDFLLRVDANQGYTPKQAVEFLDKTLPYQIEFMEQPTVDWDLAGLKYVTQHSRVPVMADETVHTPADVIRLTREGACDLINIKVMKSGGLLRSHEIATVAQAAGMGCMLGAMSETKIGMAAATHLAYSHPNILYADLDGDFDLTDDPTCGGFELRDGCNYVPETPGIGVEIDHAAMKPYVVN